jgi:hypothetical protein
MMSSREEFEAWADRKGLYASDRWIYFEGWQARGEVDAKRIAELEAKLAIAIDVQYQQARVTYIGTGTVYD